MLCCLWDIDPFLECVILSAFQHLWGRNHLICLLDGGQYKAVSWEQHRSVVSCKNTRMQVFHYSTLHVKTWWTDLIWDINAGEIGQQPLESERNVHHRRYNLRDQYFLTSCLSDCLFAIWPNKRSAGWGRSDSPVRSDWGPWRGVCQLKCFSRRVGAVAMDEEMDEKNNGLHLSPFSHPPYVSSKYTECGQVHGWGTAIMKLEKKKRGFSCYRGSIIQSFLKSFRKLPWILHSCHCSKYSETLW